MSLLELFILAAGLSMDAFAVSVCKGLAMDRVTFKKAATVGLWFGGFQSLMPTLGFILGSQFSKYITSIDHWIAFVLLCAIGVNMMREACSKSDDETSSGASLAFRVMLALAVATSIDALAVGVTFAFLNINILYAVLFIGITTFILSAVGVKTGSLFGTGFKSKAETAGGAILIIIGIKILLEHLGVLKI